MKAGEDALMDKAMMTPLTNVQAQSQGILEFFGRDACHFKCASQSAKGNLPMHGNRSRARLAA